MKTKLVAIYANGREKVVYKGVFNKQVAWLQHKWFIKMKKDANIKAIV